MKTYKVTVWCCEEIEVEAETEEEAEELAIYKSRLPYAEYCETEEI